MVGSGPPAAPLPAGSFNFQLSAPHRTHSRPAKSHDRRGRQCRAQWRERHIDQHRHIGRTHCPVWMEGSAQMGGRRLRRGPAEPKQHWSLHILRYRHANRSMAAQKLGAVPSQSLRLCRHRRQLCQPEPLRLLRYRRRAGRGPALEPLDPRSQRSAYLGEPAGANPYPTHGQQLQVIDR